jgi:hypothetical protein
LGVIPVFLLLFSSFDGHTGAFIHDGERGILTGATGEPFRECAEDFGKPDSKSPG